MHLPGWATKPLVHWFVALIAPVALTLAAHAIRAPVFALDDVTVLLVVGIALLGGLGPAALAAVLAVIVDDVIPLPGQAPLTVLEDVLDFALLIGVALVVNGLVMRAQRAQAAAEAAAERERTVRVARERVVATVAHDLATPLTVVSGTVQAAKRGGLGRTDENRMLSRLETAAARASSLVRTLTEVQDVGGVRPDRIRLVDLREILQTVVDMLEHLSDRHTIVLQLPEARLLIKADSERLHRVFENILNNAIKYSPDGGAIDVSVQQHDRVATVIIRDYGIGIAPEARGRIFDLSYRAPEALKASSGRGLGLHIAAQIVRAHGGRITAQAAPKVGTEMVVGIPLAEALVRDGAVLPQP